MLCSKAQALLISDCHDQKNSVIVRGAHQHKFWYRSHLLLWFLLLLPFLCFVLILIWNFIFQSELGGAAWWCRPPFSRMHWLWSSWSSSLSSSSSSSSSHQQSAQTDSLMSWPFHRVTGTWGWSFHLCLYTKAAPVWKNVLNKLWPSIVLIKGSRQKTDILGSGWP